MDTNDFTEEDYEEYIDFLHDRIQFLEEELKKSEETVLELQQEQASSDPGSLLDGLDLSPEPGDLRELSPEDFQGFEDLMLHDPEEVLEDPEKAFEEMLNAANRLQEQRETLDRLDEVNKRIEENNEEWFED
ncbi:hypothetical protein SAMN05443574_103300 [Haloarcula vallismortis]|uniref:Uncharacterized protein n=2 Tax=Haloarcula vallismortis TaxID=28442 RepID=M0JRI2_HALVA|nr:hypothetical protein [Haloarcula vallismortis]EMA11566.1 hypothetical protein C437_01600 [Haloarcula vallismortis ATCC 29715]SDW45039.1 hypothetical protein SAMN05443574_103300 [Haloarcula vallismortis]